MSHVLSANSEFKQITSELQHPVQLVINTTSLSAFSLIIEGFSQDGNPKNFNGEVYQIFVSNDAYDTIPDPKEVDSYYNVMIAAPHKGWTHLLDINLGTSNQVNNSFDGKNWSAANAAAIHFKYVKIWVDEIEGTKVRITASAR